MIRVRFHGRGGQGAKTASRIVGTAAFLQGYTAQDSPIYGAERRGAPVAASLYHEPLRPQALCSFIGGLGGKNISEAEFEAIFARTAEAVPLLAPRAFAMPWTC